MKKDEEIDKDVISGLILFDSEKGWGSISSGLTANFEANINSFNIRFKDGTEHRVEVRINEV